MREIFVYVRNDSVAEPEEIMTITVMSASVQVNFTVEAVTVTIIDDDGE